MINKNTKRIAFFILIISLLLSPVVHISASADGNIKKVRVAVEDSNIFFKTDDADDPVSGYAYEYIQNIAAYSNWEVEYVFCGSFADCLQGVKDGTVDVFYDVSHTDERAEWLAYPEMPMGTEEYYLFCLTSSKGLHSDDLSSLSGKRAGVTAGTIEGEELEQWCVGNGVELEIVEYASDPEKDAALEAGEIDIEYEISMLAKRNFSALAKVSSSDYYMVAGKDRADLIYDINEAYKKIESVNKYFVEHLNEKYFAKSVLSRTLSKDEALWVSAHETLKIGYPDNYMPFSDMTENGEVDGIVKDIVPKMFENIGLGGEFEIEYIGFSDDSDMYAALQKGEIDVVFPVYDNVDFGSHNGAIITSSVISLSADIAYVGKYSENTVSTIAVNRANKLQEYYTKTVYPDAKIVYYGTVDECLMAVSRGEVGLTVLNGLRTTALLSDSDYGNITAVRLAEPFSFSFAVSVGNSALLSVFNRAIISMDDGFAFNYAFNYINSDNLTSLSSFFETNKVLIMTIIIIVLTVILIVIVTASAMIGRNRKRLAESKSVTDYLLTPYESVYYINLKDMTWSSEKRSKEVSENYAVRKNYTYAFREYIEAEVSPEDIDTVSILLDPVKIKEKLCGTNGFGITFKAFTNGQDKYIRADVFKGADDDHVSFGFLNITDEFLAHQKKLMGAMPISPDILTKANIGLWAFELDEGKPPRMYVDEAMLGLIGLDHQISPEETYHAWYDYIDKECYGLVAEAVDKMVAGEHAEVQYPWHHPDGHTMIVRCGGVRNPGYTDGVRIEGTHQDVTETIHFDEEERKRQFESERTLANQQRQMKSFGDMINAALWSMTIDDDNVVTEVRWSDEFRKMFGFEPTVEDFPNTVEAWSSRLHPDDREKTLEHFDNSIRSRNTNVFVYDMEYRILKKNGEYCWYHALGRMENNDDGTRNMYGIIYDISADKKLEEQHRQLEEALEMAQAANSAKTTFLFNMSHDIRTPMNAILGFTDMAKQNVGNNEKLLDCIDKTQRAGYLLLSLINSVLEMSRIEAGKAELDETPGDVMYSFKNIESTMLELAEKKNITLTFAVENITDRYVFADFDRCVRIFINIISNAIKYTDNGGYVKVKCEQTGRTDEEHGLYRYTFEDNGFGMSKEFQKHIFEEFVREKNVIVSGIQGTGLGLSVVKSFVDLMGGTIDFESIPDKGTTFTVVLPFRLQKDEENAQFVDPDTRRIVDVHTQSKDIDKKEFTLAGRRILLVEDNELNREIAIYMLKEQGLVVEEANDGTVAVELLELKGADYYDFILMDIQMPLMDGYEATKAIRKMYPGAKLPIIALSANAFAEDKIASVAAGMNDHIAKPIDFEVLIDVLSGYLE